MLEFLGRIEAEQLRLPLRIGPAASRATLNLGPHRELPPDYSKRKAEYNEAYRQYHVKLLCEGSPTVRDVVGKLDVVLGPRNITCLCKPTHAEVIKGFPCNNPYVWYPEELLSIEWGRFVQATRQGESLGFVEAFLKREGTKLVFEGWRYLGEMKLEKAGTVFHGPPAKMIRMARHLEKLVWSSLRHESVANHSDASAASPSSSPSPKQT